MRIESLTKSFPFVFAGLLLLGLILAGARVDLVLGRIRLAPIGWLFLMGALGCALGLAFQTIHLIIVRKEKLLTVALVISPIAIFMFVVFRALFVGLLEDAAMTTR